jgi:hypothetical protein
MKRNSQQKVKIKEFLRLIHENQKTTSMDKRKFFTKLLVERIKLS